MITLVINALIQIVVPIKKLGGIGNVINAAHGMMITDPGVPDVEK